MGEIKIAGDRTQQVVQEIMKREGLDEDDALKMIIELGLKDYVVELYKQGDLTIREAAMILGLSLRQTLEIVERKIGGNVRRGEAVRALKLAKNLADIK
jgi:predicted HTH domain antitoxin